MRETMARASRGGTGTPGVPDPSCGGGGPAANLHVELAFLGSVPQRRPPELAEVAKCRPSRRRRLGRFACKLQDLLVGRDFAPDLKPFRPHVTVVRKVLRAGPLERIDPGVWGFTEIALIESRTRPEGALYSVVESYSLCGADKSANNGETP
jgi:2'-5' RNA ligase